MAQNHNGSELVLNLPESRVILVTIMGNGERIEMVYQVIVPIKESNKGNVCLANVEGYDFPVIVKELKHGNIELYKTLQGLECEYVPQIHEIEERTDGLLIVEEYIEGELLSGCLEAGRLDEATWIDIAMQLCRALSVLHNQLPPIIHRDIKPSNIIISSRNRVKLIDFDSSRLYKEDAGADTRLLGTRMYAPPEQYGFSQTDNRSDIYSLGVVLSMFPAFASETRQERWRQMVEKCTLFAPESRFQSAEEVLAEIDNIRNDKQTKNRKGIVICGVIVLMVLGICLVLRNALMQDNEVESENNLANAIVLEENPNKIIAPEWRDLEEDSLAYVELKNEIRTHNSIVLYYFKDRLNKEFLLQSRELERPGSGMLGVDLENIEDGKRYSIEDRYVEVREQQIWIKTDYLKSLEDGYYRLIIKLQWADGACTENSFILYVAESDPLEEPEIWLQNTTLSFYGMENMSVYAAMKNDSSNEIVSLRYDDGTEVEESLYQILYDGRVIGLSNHLLSQYQDKMEVIFFVVGKDESEVAIKISNCCQE